MFVSPDNWQDAQKYFNGCFIRVKETDMLVHLNKVTMEGLFGIDENNNNIFIEFDGVTTKKVGYDLDYILPQKSFFQDKTVAKLLYRIPARMWRKGLCEENTKIESLGGGFGKAAINFATLKAYVNRTYLPWTEYQANLSVALSPRFAMNSIGEIYIDKLKIGKYLTTTKSVLVKQMFVPEITQLFPGVLVRGM